MSFTLSKADRKQHNDFWNSNQTDTILRLQDILTVVSNVTLTTLNTCSRGKVFRHCHFHVGTKTQKNAEYDMLSIIRNLTYTNRKDRHARVTLVTTGGSTSCCK